MSPRSSPIPQSRMPSLISISLLVVSCSSYISYRYCSAPELVSSDDKKDDKPASSNVEPDEKDIKLVMEQASVEREKAVKAIKEADGDLINASESEF